MDNRLPEENHFIYKENINAAYVNLNKQLSKKWSAQAGLQWRTPTHDGNQLTTGEPLKEIIRSCSPRHLGGYIER